MGLTTHPVTLKEAPLTQTPDTQSLHSDTFTIEYITEDLEAYDASVPFLRMTLSEDAYVDLPRFQAIRLARIISDFTNVAME